MNKKFNLLCLIMLLAVFFSIFVPMATTFSTGFVHGWASEDDSRVGIHPITGVMNSVEMLPRQALKVFHDSIYNKKTNEMEGIQIFHCLVHSPKVNRGDFPVYSTVVTLSGLALLVLSILFLVVFIKIILAVNKGKIFDAKMEKRMAQCGFLLIGCYGLSWLNTYLQYAHNKCLYDFDNYNICILQHPNAAYLLGGIGLLLVGQIFKIARKMKEEQELTI